MHEESATNGWMTAGIGQRRRRESHRITEKNHTRQHAAGCTQPAEAAAIPSTQIPRCCPITWEEADPKREGTASGKSQRKDVYKMRHEALSASVLLLALTADSLNLLMHKSEESLAESRTTIIH